MTLYSDLFSNSNTTNITQSYFTFHSGMNEIIFSNNRNMLVEKGETLEEQCVCQIFVLN